MLKVYGFGKVNPFARGHTRDLRVLWALEEMQLPYRIVGLDHPAQELSTDGYRALSPFEQIPAIDDDGLMLSESAAILVHLAKKSGRLWAPDAAAQAQVIRWCFATVSTIEPPLQNVMVMGWFGSEDFGKYRGFMTDWVHRVLGNLDRWLDGREFLATDAFTVADILLAHVLEMIKDESLVAPFPRVLAFRQRCLSRPAWKRTLDGYLARVEAG